MANQPLLRSLLGHESYTEFVEITQNNGSYVVQGHSRSPILIPIESPYMTSYCFGGPHIFTIKSDDLFSRR